jgi:hypothetical protein
LLGWGLAGSGRLDRIAGIATSGGFLMSVVDPSGRRVEPSRPGPARSLTIPQVRYLMAVFLYQSGVPEARAVRALGIDRTTYYRRVNRAAALRARLDD